MSTEGLRDSRTSSISFSPFQSLPLSHTHAHTHTDHTNTLSHRIVLHIVVLSSLLFALWLIMHRLAPVFIFNPVFLHFFPFRTLSSLYPISRVNFRHCHLPVWEWVSVCVCVSASASVFSSSSSSSAPFPSSSFFPPNRSSFLFVIFRFRRHFGHRSSLLLYILSCTCVRFCVYVSVCVSPALWRYFFLLFSVCISACACVFNLCVCVCMYLDWRVDGNFACFSHFVCFINFKICNKFSII